MINLNDLFNENKFLSDWNNILKLLALLLYSLLLLYTTRFNIKLDSEIIAIASFFIFIIIFFYRPKFSSNNEFFLALFAIIVLGILIRLYLSYVFYGNFDMESYELVSNIVLKGQNVYNETLRYNYSPIWFNVLGFLKLVTLKLSNISFHFVVRGFLTIIDVLTLVVLVSLSKLENLSNNQIIIVCIFFFLSPVSYLLTGYHGQFENFAILFILLGIYIYKKSQNRTCFSKVISWIFLTMAVIIKHDTLADAIIGINNLFKRKIYVIFFIVLTGLSFILVFIPYLSVGKQGIIQNVFLYNSREATYGITAVANLPLLKYLFIVALILYPFIIKNREFIIQFLLGALFFLTFTTGIGIQYFIFPIAFSSLRSSNWFLLYSFITSIVLLGLSENLGLPGFNLININAIWMCVLFWFVFLHFDIKFKPNESILK